MAKIGLRWRRQLEWYSAQLQQQAPKAISHPTVGRGDHYHYGNARHCKILLKAEALVDREQDLEARPRHHGEQITVLLPGPAHLRDRMDMVLRELLA